MDTQQQQSVLEINKLNLAKTRVVSEPKLTLQSGQIRLAVDKFALTANNITYGVAGELLGYWRFFPASEEQEKWGRIPVMAFATVVESNNDEIVEGERVFGFFPMTQSLVIQAGQITPFGFSDTAQYRHQLSSVYANYERVAKNPFYNESTEPYHLLVKGLYTTSWLIDDFMTDHNFFGASQYVISSASSKTSMALAFASRQCANGKAVKLVGLTSSSRVEFVTSTGLYDEVISYDEIAKLDNRKASIFVDMAGSQQVLASVHNHFAENLVYSCSVGATHVGDLSTNTANNVSLPGAKPEMFFAPAQIKIKSKTIGGAQLTVQIAQSMNLFIDEIKQHIKVQEITNFEQLNECYMSLLSGQADASIGFVYQY
ncbi:DUF2855 family protein [Thalassotalea euphylliae]|uniref:DUF2855 family protein n=1 Tax=Thalassotalea euphylliae TaxID=1655234 RepID=A0A3E0UIL1_9GAMM|nr:DUF2855 family protein [Thalassotalea euphylliae]REL35592.1 DUF2855 family protein [Thalassotalea euphylliae]